MAKKKTTEEFIADARQVHGDKYDYSKVEYVNSQTPVTIICPKHGEFKQRPSDHLSGRGCYKCGIESRSQTHRLSTEEFIDKARQIHGQKYDYSKVKYINSHTNVTLVCSKHGEFKITPNSHLNGRGCKECGLESSIAKHRLTREGFIRRAQEIHEDKYDYSKVVYQNYDTPVIIICPQHGEFLQTPNLHLQGKGCSACAGNRKLTTQSFIQRAQEIHGDKYDYSKTDLTQKDEKGRVCIICPKHGEFWQDPIVHLRKHGCPYCQKSWIEEEVEKALIDNQIDYIVQARFEWLKYQRSMPLDFFLPQYNIAIECQGLQHYQQRRFGKTIKDKDKLDRIQKRDLLKKRLCEEHGIKMLYFSHEKCATNAISSIEQLLKEIKA